MNLSRVAAVQWWKELDHADQAKALAWQREGGQDMLPERLIASLLAADLVPATYPSAPEQLPWLTQFLDTVTLD